MKSKKQRFNTLITLTFFTPIIILALICISGIKNPYITPIVLSSILTAILSIFLWCFKTNFLLHALILSTIFSTHSLENIAPQLEAMIENIEKSFNEQVEAKKEIAEIRKNEKTEESNQTPIPEEDNQKNNEKIEKYKFYATLIQNIFKTIYIFLSAHLFFIREKIEEYFEEIKTNTAHIP
ncbi:hypothetical protein QMO40_10475 [Mannheimia bovis]|uniref:hypothetical protein n=1 Tax=Mannheimia bovis TaxID=2770636 RepID=UPI0024B64E07|nr:hypothetical protein [Mannheimia bovis]WHP47030.1 hypothetical protein QMO40_10475 [Mannheimia bovis]